MSKARLTLWVCSLLLGMAAYLALPGHAEEARPAVVVLELDGIINPATADFISRGIQDAAKGGAALVVIELDTPGGLDASMRSIVRQILGSPIPVTSFVSPGGARAASAGTFILYASHIAAMTPASNLGAATPVSIGMPSGGDRTAPEDKEKTGTDPMANKVRNDAAAYIRSLAQLRGRNAEFGEQAVLEGRSMSAQEALKAGAIDFVASDLDELLRTVDGKSIKLNERTQVELNVTDATIIRVVPGWRTQVLGLLANPQVAVILMMLGIYGLFFELLSPGAALPGVAGLICLVLAMYAFQMLPVNWAGVGLLSAGAAMMIAEAFLPSFGVLGIGGIIAFVLGGIFLTDTGIPGFDLSIPFLVGLAVVSIGLILLIATMASRSHKRAVVSGIEQMPGMPGIVTVASEGAVYAEVGGESWKVRCNEPLSAGDHIRVISIQGLTLQVSKTYPLGNSAPHI